MEPPTPPPAHRREIEGRAVIPRAAADNLAPRRTPSDEVTRRGEAAPPRRPIATPAGMLVPARGESRRGGMVLLAALLVLLVGGLVFFQAFLRRNSGGTLGGALVVTPAATSTLAPPTQSPAPTEAPIAVSTATSPAASPTGAPTAAPTQAPQPTVAPRPTATPQPTATPRPTATAEPTASPSPTACPSLLAGGFAKLWDENASVRERVGCPLGAEQGGPATIAEQPFERGSMFYFSPLEQVYVLIGVDSGRWRLFEKRSLDDLPTPTPAVPPPCEDRLTGGFGLVWSSFPQIQEALGCALQPEDGLLEGAYQPFARGRMLYSRQGLGRGKTIYVLYADGGFERYDDTNP
jgi:serine/threonine-protein kinase